MHINKSVFNQLAGRPHTFTRFAGQLISQAYSDKFLICRVGMPPVALEPEDGAAVSRESGGGEQSGRNTGSGGVLSGGKAELALALALGAILLGLMVLYGYVYENVYGLWFAFNGNVSLSIRPASQKQKTGGRQQIQSIFVNPIFGLY